MEKQLFDNKKKVLLCYSDLKYTAPDHPNLLGTLVIIVLHFAFVLQDVISKRRADTILDLNIEKSRVKEMVSTARSKTR